MSETNEDWPEITIDDSFIRIYGVTPEGDDFLIPRWLRAPLLDALLRERGYEKRFVVERQEWRRRNLYETQQGDPRAVTIYVPSVQQEGESE